MARRRICLYLAGSAPEEVARDWGSFSDWFARLCGAFDVELALHDGQRHGLPERLREYDGFIITGSPASLAAPEPWMAAGVELVRWALGQRTPLLGVCFGHQLIGAALGARISENPRGWEISTFAIELASAASSDPLLAGLPPRFDVNLSHKDVILVDTLPGDGAVVLGKTERTDVQVLAAGPAVRGVQFHPEFTGAITRSYIRSRWQELGDEARRRNSEEDQPQHLWARARDCPLGERLFANFLTHFVLGRAASE